MNVALKQIDIAEVATVAGIELSAREEDFAGGSMNAIAERVKAGSDPEDCFPFLIVTGPTIAGFMMLRKGHALPVWAPPGVFSLHNFRITKEMRGRGFGTEAVVLAARWIATHYPRVSRVIGSVNIENTVSREFCLSCGFKETGMYFNGRLGKEMILSCQVAELLKTSL